MLVTEINNPHDAACVTVSGNVHDAHRVKMLIPRPQCGPDRRQVAGWQPAARPGPRRPGWEAFLLSHSDEAYDLRTLWRAHGPGVATSRSCTGLCNALTADGKRVLRPGLPDGPTYRQGYGRNQQQRFARHLPIFATCPCHADRLKSRRHGTKRRHRRITLCNSRLSKERAAFRSYFNVGRAIPWG